MERLRVDTGAIEQKEYVALLRHFFRLGRPPCPLNERRELERGLQTVNLWKSRGALPHAILATANLVTAILNETDCADLVYAQALQYFVTGYTDAEQEKKRKISAFEVAKKIGMPDAFVALRNNIAHGQTPSVMELRRFAHAAIRWLWEEYWVNLVPQQHGCQPPEDLSADTPCQVRDFDIAAMRKVVQTYQDKTVPPEDKKVRHGIACVIPSTASRSASKALREICGNDDYALEMLAADVVKEGRMLPESTSTITADVPVYQWWSLIRAVAKNLTKFGPIIILKLASRLAQSSVKNALPDHQAIACKVWLDTILLCEQPDGRWKFAIANIPYAALLSKFLAYPGPYTTSSLLHIYRSRRYASTNIKFEPATLAMLDKWARAGEVTQGLMDGNDDRLLSLDDISGLWQAVGQASEEIATRIASVPGGVSENWTVTLVHPPKPIGSATVIEF